MLNKLLRDRGVSLVEALFAVSLLIGASVFALKNVDSLNKIEEKSKRVESASYLSTVINSQVKNVFVSTKNDQGKRTEGICSLVRPESINSSVTSLYLNLPTYKDNLFSETRWNKHFPGLKLVNISKCKGLEATGYVRCFEIDPTKIDQVNFSDDQLKKLDPKFLVSVKPVVTNPLADETFKFLSKPAEQKIDVKSVGFETQIKISFKRSVETNNRQHKTIKGFIWSGDIGECDYQSKILTVSSTGFGDQTGRYIYNSGGFNKQLALSTLPAPLKIEAEHFQAQSGELRQNTNGNEYITTQLSSLVFSSCNEKKFVCPQLKKDSQRVYEYMQHRVKMTYNVPNDVSHTASSMSLSPTLRFINGTNGRYLKENGTEVGIYINNKKYMKSNNKSDLSLYYAPATDGSNASIPYKSSGVPTGSRSELMFGGSRNVDIIVNDQYDNSSSNNVCRQICTERSGYNSNDNGRIYTSIEYDINQSTNNKLRQKRGDAVSCTACYMKSCDRLGLKTFGPMKSSPTEPLDSTMPECVLHEDEYISDYMEVTPMGESNANKCLSMRLKSGDNSGYVYTVNDCSESKNVLCYNFGKHLLAQTIATSGFKSRKSSFDGAQRVCFETSKEILQADSMTKFFKQGFGNLRPEHTQFLQEKSSGNTTTFFNLAKAGSFLNPIGKNQERALRKYGEEKGFEEQMKKRDFWVNLKTDSLGYVYAPAIKEVSSNSHWALFFDGQSHITTQKIVNNSFRLENNVSNQGAALFNQSKLKGVVMLNDRQPLINSHDGLAFVCRKEAYPHEVFLTHRKSNRFSKGQDYCRNERGLFYPPTTTGDWIKVMHMINSPLSDRAFLGATAKPAWIALKSNMKPSYKFSFSGPIDQYLENDGTFVDKAKGLKKAFLKHLCLDRDKARFYVQGYSCSDALSKNEFMKVIGEDNRILKLSLISVIGKDTGRGLLKLYN